MSRQEAILLASRSLALLLAVWALTDLSYLPGSVHSFLHYLNYEHAAPGTEYLRHYYLIALGFLVTRIVGYCLVAKWLYRGGPEIEELFLPARAEDSRQI